MTTNKSECMIPKEAIERAIEGGWNCDEWKECDTSKIADIGQDLWCCEGVCLSWQFMALDPLFWQSLGKALGWGEIKAVHEHDPSKPFHRCPIGRSSSDPKHYHGCYEKYDQGWQTKAHRFYDLILTGGDTKDYWNNLLHHDE